MFCFNSLWCFVHFFLFFSGVGLCFGEERGREGDGDWEYTRSFGCISYWARVQFASGLVARIQGIERSFCVM